MKEGPTNETQFDSSEDEMEELQNEGQNNDIEAVKMPPPPPPTGSPSSQLLQQQIWLLEKQLHETKQLLHEHQHQTDGSVTATPRHGNGKSYREYGAINSDTTPLLLSRTTSTSVPSDDAGPPVHIIPEENQTTANRSTASHSNSISGMIDDAVSQIKDFEEDEFTKQEVNQESEAYLSSTFFERAFPERQFALFVTLCFELPVLFMIRGGSDQLCALVGRSRYQLLLAFLPLTSAISGNVGLQASTLTTRAISHNHVTAQSYMPWFCTEMGASFCLAMGMGTIMSLLAYVSSSDADYPLAVTIFVAQVISIVTAGCTGTIAPLLFSFIFKRDSGKWGGPLETAVQDIVGSFAMVIISYKILQLLGPHDIDPSDVCGAAE